MENSLSNTVCFTSMLIPIVCIILTKKNVSKYPAENSSDFFDVNQKLKLLIYKWNSLTFCILFKRISWEILNQHKSICGYKCSTEVFLDVGAFFVICFTDLNWCHTCFSGCIIFMIKKVYTSILIMSYIRHLPQTLQLTILFEIPTRSSFLFIDIYWFDRGRCLTENAKRVVVSGLERVDHWKWWEFHLSVQYRLIIPRLLDKLNAL